MIDLSELAGLATPSEDQWTIFTAAEMDEMPAEHRDQFRFLDRASTKAAYEAADRLNVICGGDVWGNDPYAGGCYATVDRFAPRGPLDECVQQTKKWLYRRGVPFRDDVLILPVFGSEHTPVVQATWKMVVTYAADVFFRDNLVVAPPSAAWSLYYHHDNLFYFAREKNWAYVPGDPPE